MDRSRLFVRTVGFGEARVDCALAIVPFSVLVLGALAFHALF